MGPSEVGLEFRRVREAKELTQQQVADMAGLSVSFVCQMERRASHRLLPPAASRIARVLGFELVTSYDLLPLRRRRVSR